MGDQRGLVGTNISFSYTAQYGVLQINAANPFSFLALAALQSSTVTALADVTTWTLSVTSGKSYRIEIIASYQAAATTTGIKLGVYLYNSGAGTIHGFLAGSIVNTVAATELKMPIYAIGASNLTGSFLLTSGVGVINSPHNIRGTMVFTCTVTGTLRFQMASEVASSAAQLNAGSTMLVTQLN